MDDAAFLGIGWSFPPEFALTGIKMVSAEADIRESLVILLSTSPGERLLQPDFGCDLMKCAFEVLNHNRVTLIKDMIRRAILHFESRITLEKIEIGSVDTQTGSAPIDIFYTVRATNTRFNIVFPFYVTEGTDVTV